MSVGWRSGTCRKELRSEVALAMDADRAGCIATTEVTPW